MNLLPHNYNFYATLLDAYQWYLKSERETATQELIDKINRVPVVDEEALLRMNRGTALNALVDYYIQTGNRNLTHTINGIEYTFDAELIESLYQKLDGSICQMRVYHELNRSVMLYGDLDYLKNNRVIDLKTTGEYVLGKYHDSIQRHLYPVALSGDIDIEGFDFVVVQFKGGHADVFIESYPFDYYASLNVLNELSEGLIRFVNEHINLITDKKIIGLS